jgi:hypothetical protein
MKVVTLAAALVLYHSIYISSLLSISYDILKSVSVSIHSLSPPQKTAEYVVVSHTGFKIYLTAFKL